jgi:hypothetical protein
MTSDKETLILTNLFALTLHIDNFVVDTALIAKDLSMSSTKYAPIPLAFRTYLIAMGQG